MNLFKFIYKLFYKLFRIYNYLQLRIKSYMYNKIYFENFPIIFKDNVKLKIIKCKNSNFIVKGKLYISSYMNGKEEVYIRIGENSSILIDGDFVLGNGTKIFLENNANLYIGGKKNESLSGITKNTTIMVKKQLHIGYDAVISWDVFITDCDWHKIEGQSPQEDIFIGNHVWITSGVKILKGSYIGDNCILGTNSIINSKIDFENSLIAGNPAKVIKSNISWSRDL